MRTLGHWLAGLLIVDAAVDLAAAFADLDQLDVLSRLLDGEDVSFEEVAFSDQLVGITGALQALTTLTIIVVWLVWFRRAYTSVPRLSNGDLRWGTGWAIGAWFVPILNYIRPKAMMNDIWRAGDPQPPRDVAFHDRRVSPLLHWWWGIWIGSTLLANGATRLLFRAETVEDQHRGAQLMLASDGLDAFVSVVTAFVVVQVTHRYDHRRDEVLADAPATAPVG